ncbi:uncharacterized protein METZ01_LOCUS66576 [marine metagenome]|uniref:Uncharacterized protein n=1 Tax=marine metagenome TaxID=408172 RepID=A0A381TC36_9ZZZZ
MMVFKNFASINQNLVVKEGELQHTMSAQKNIVGKVKLKDKFPREWPIYDLNEFLSVMSMYDNPNLDFKESFVVVRESENTDNFFNYQYSDVSVVTTPQQEIVMPEPEISFTLTSDVLTHIERAAAVIGAPDMVLESMTKGVALLKVLDKKNDDSNVYAVKININNEDGKDVPYKFWFKVDNFKLLPGEYNVTCSAKRVSHFQHKNTDIEYWIAGEPATEYNAINA